MLRQFFFFKSPHPNVKCTYLTVPEMQDSVYRYIRVVPDTDLTGYPAK